VQEPAIWIKIMALRAGC